VNRMTESRRNLEKEYKPTKIKGEIISATANKLIDSYILGDFRSNSLENDTFDLIEIDPPYGIDLENIRSTTYKGALEKEYQEIKHEEYPKFIEEILAEAFRLGSKNSWTIVWCGWQYYPLVLDTMKKVGYNPRHIPGIWKKGNSPGQSLQPDMNLGNACEMFIYASKGNPTILKQGRSNVFDFQGVFYANKIHPTERPIDLMDELVSTFGAKNGSILVPFAGSGVTLFAGIKHLMDVKGFDLSREFREFFIDRAIKQFPPFIWETKEVEEEIEGLDDEDIKLLEEEIG